jgi:hypothetical protein
VKRVVAFATVFLLSVTLAPLHAPAISALSEAPEPIARSFPTQISGVANFGSPNDGVPWGLDRLDQRTPISSVAAQRSYTYSSGSTGAGVTVYVVDSGVQADHSDFGNRIANGWSYRADPIALSSYRNSRNLYSVNPANGIAPCPSTYDFNDGGATYERQFDPAVFDGPSTTDDNDFATTDNDGHGTHVAGIVAGTLAGVAKDVAIVPVRVLDSCGAGTLTMILNGLNWILQQHVPGNKAVVNLSLGFGTTVSDVDSVITQMINKGMIVVAAAGNSGVTSCGTTPAGTPGTFSVGASFAQNINGSFRDREVEFSNYGDCVDLFAPGAQIVSPWSHLQIQGSSAVASPFVTISGTSMAAPHVSGVLARYLHTISLPVNANSSVSTNAWAWTQLHATCNAVTYHLNSRTMQTPNRLLAMEAPVGIPCAPRALTATPAVDAATFTWSAPVAHNGEQPTYEVALSPGGFGCVTAQLTCTVSGLNGNTQYSVSVVTRNSAGSSTAALTTVTPIPSVSQLRLTPGDGTVTATWAAVSGLTYVAVISPGNIRCVTTTTSCVFTDLVNDQTYNVTVTGENSLESSSATGAVAPNGAPKVPTVVRTSTRIGRVTFRWRAISGSANPTYVLATLDGRHSCTTTTTSCTIRGLPNGKLRKLYLSTRTTAGGESVTRTAVRVRAGFKLRKSTVKRSSRVSLTSIVAPISRGRVTWRSSPSCRIVGTRLVTPNRRVTCYLNVMVGRSGKIPPMSTRVKLAIR